MAPTLRDKEYNIFFNETAVIYSNELAIENLNTDNYVYSLLFKFQDDDSKEMSINIEVKKEQNLAEVSLTNFNNILGAGTTDRVKILETHNSAIFFSIFSRALNPERTNALQVTITLYERRKQGKSNTTLGTT